MDEDLREKLKSYFSAPADAPISMKFAGWNDDDYKKLDALGVIDPRTPEEWKRYRAFCEEFQK